MSEYLKTPILFLTFNRLDTTKRVFEVIKEVRPQRLYIASDGPRESVAGESFKVKMVRDYLVANIDWGCDVRVLFKDKNLGCKVAVSDSIDWFFKNEERGIILEDDCLPDKSFFQFCEELLERYENNEEISVISGNNINKEKIGDFDYYFSKIPRVWGWATWRKKWEKYDLAMSNFTSFKERCLVKEIWSNKNVQEYWLDILNEVYENKIDTWDYQLTFSLFVNKCFSICPNDNLVSNIGFGKEFTNTALVDKRVSGIETKRMFFPINHPEKIEYFEQNDEYSNNVFLKNYRIKKFLKKIGFFNIFKRLYVFIKKI